MTNNRPRTPSPAEHIAAEQTKIIATLRHDNPSLIDTNAKQAQRIEYLEEEVTEYRDLKAAFGGNGNLTYYQAMAVVQTLQNAVIQRQHNMINSQRRADLEAYRQTAHDAEVKKALDNNPHLVNDCNERKAKIQATKDEMLELAKRFYDLTEEQAAQYINLKHKPDESAVKHLINEIIMGEMFQAARLHMLYLNVLIVRIESTPL